MSCPLAIFRNTLKVYTKTTMKDNKMKNQNRSWYTMPPLSKEKK